MTYKVFLKKGDDGKYIASVPSLLGCHSEGDTIDEAMKNIKEATRGYLKVVKKYGDKVGGDDTQTLETTLFIPSI